MGPIQTLHRKGNHQKNKQTNKKQPLPSDTKDYLQSPAQGLAEWVLNYCAELKMNEWTEMLKSWIKAPHIVKSQLLPN